MDWGWLGKVLALSLGVFIMFARSTRKAHVDRSRQLSWPSGPVCGWPFWS